MPNKVLFSIIAIASSMFTVAAVAQDVSVPLTRQGVPGRWFPRSVVDEIQRDLLELDNLRITKTELEAKLELRLQRISDLKLALDISDKSMIAAKRSMEASANIIDKFEARSQRAERLVRDAEDRANRWYRHPIFWFSSGVVVSIAGAVFVYQIAN